VILRPPGMLFANNEVANMKTLILTLALFGTVLAMSPSAEAGPREYYWHHRYWHHRYWHHHYYGYQHRGYWAYRNGVQVYIPL
jgi:hypothetical protein